MTRQITLTVPELSLVVGTRAALGAGLALLIGERFLDPKQRRAVGWTLAAIGVVTTIPLAVEIFGKDIKDINNPRVKADSRSV